MRNDNGIFLCDKCTHSPESPCHQLIDCLNGEIECKSDAVAKAFAENLLKYYRYIDIQKPIIYIGMGTCGLGAGAGKTLDAIKEYLATHDYDVDIQSVGCIGLCSYEPIVEIQLPGRTRVAFKNVYKEAVSDLLDDVLCGIMPVTNLIGQHRNDSLKSWDSMTFLDEHPFFKNQTRWVLKNCGIINPVEINEYIAHGGFRALSKALSNHTSFEICDIIEKSGLKGRGGGGFLTGRKWKMAHNEISGQKYLICNADEGDPGAFMDRALIEGDPYRLIEGMIIAAYGIGASEAYIYIRAEYPLAIEHLRTAIESARRYGLLGKNILDSGFNFEIKIKMGAGAFVCGEETALIKSIEGKRGMPRPRPPFPTTAGLFDKPTVINNVETLANVPEIINNGADWFNSAGTDTSKGTKVFALSGNINFTGLVEVKMGTELREIIYEIGGGIPNNKKFKAVQIGGPSGGCIPESQLHIDIDYESLKSVGAMMGSGGMVVMDEDTCMVDVAKFFMDFIQRESCGKCIPCREGTRRILEILERITSKPNNEDKKSALERIESMLSMQSLSVVIQETSLCGLGKSSTNPILSTLRWFRDEYEEHLFEKKCSAKVCRNLLTFSINQENCTGCTICAKNCPCDAILGTLKKEHYIVMDKCIACGNCKQVCRFDAVEVF